MRIAAQYSDHFPAHQPPVSAVLWGRSTPRCLKQGHSYSKHSRPPRRYW